MAANKKVVILGLDGLEPKLLEKYISQGELPNFQKLSDSYYSKLATSNPPQSPVAWSNFITNNTPKDHQVFDFITRDPQNLLPHLTFSHALNKQNPIKATPFWEKSLSQDIPTQVLFLPNTFPLPKLNKNKDLLTLISGMGTPGLDGTESTCHFYSTDKEHLPQEARSHLIHIEDQQTIDTHIKGPRKQTTKGTQFITIPLKLKSQKDHLRIQVQDQEITLKPDQLSDWIELKFSLNFLKKLHGTAHFYLKSLHPLQLYLSPINFHPQNPPFPISQPRNLSSQLTDNFDFYSTLGLPNDTWALEHDFITPKIFLKIAHQIIDKREQIFLQQLKNFSGGLFVSYFNTPDPIQHMFWKNKNTEGDPHQSAIKDVYKRLDQTLGKFQKHLKKNDLFIVLSDHGFGPLNYHVNLNNLLIENNLLTLKKNKKTNDLLQNTNWKKTKAYALGFNSIYLNLKNREKHGVVTSKQEPQVTKKIIKILENLSFQGESVINHVYTKKELNISNLNNAPDLIVGYKKGFRASWETAVGDLGERVLTKNNQKWSGDHLFDGQLVPGILLSNQKLKIKNPKISDITTLGLRYLK